MFVGCIPNPPPPPKKKIQKRLKPQSLVPVFPALQATSARIGARYPLCKSGPREFRAFDKPILMCDPTSSEIPERESFGRIPSGFLDLQT